jgi:Tfp pilus assembly protein PilX
MAAVLAEAEKRTNEAMAAATHAAEAALREAEMRRKAVSEAAHQTEVAELQTRADTELARMSQQMKHAASEAERKLHAAQVRAWTFGQCSSNSL